MKNELFSCLSRNIVSRIPFSSILMFGLPSVYSFTGSIFSFYFWEVFPYITPVVYPIGLIAQTSSAYLTLVVTIEVRILMFNTISIKCGVLNLIYCFKIWFLKKCLKLQNAGASFCCMRNLQTCCIAKIEIN